MRAFYFWRNVAQIWWRKSQDSAADPGLFGFCIERESYASRSMHRAWMRAQAQNN